MLLSASSLPSFCSVCGQSLQIDSINIRFDTFTGGKLIGFELGCWRGEQCGLPHCRDCQSHIDAINFTLSQEEYDVLIKSGKIDTQYLNKE